MGSFISLVFSTFGGIDRAAAAAVLYRRLISFSLQKESCDVMAVLQD